MTLTLTNEQACEMLAQVARESGALQERVYLFELATAINEAFGAELCLRAGKLSCNRGGEGEK